MPKLDDHCRSELDALAKAYRRRELKETTRDGVHVTQNGPFVSFSCNDYLGLGQHSEVIAAGVEALKKYGAGAGASRLVTGNHPLYAPLETKLALMKHTEAALVFGSGYLTNLGVIPALMEKGDVIYADKRIHACMLDAAQLSGAALKRFRHNDVQHLATLFKERGHYKKAVILAEHVYSMDGDLAPIGEYSKLARTHDAWLMVDDAHGMGLITPDKHAEVDLWMGTLSKSVGVYGGYLAAKKPVIDHLVSSARSLLFSTGLPPADCAAALAALEIMEREPARGQRALQHAAKLCQALDIPFPGSAIVPILLGDERSALEASEALKKRGMLVMAIRPPTVPPGTARLRVSFSASHTDAEVDQLIAALAAEHIRPLPCHA